MKAVGRTKAMHGASTLTNTCGTPLDIPPQPQAVPDFSLLWAKLKRQANCLSQVRRLRTVGNSLLKKTLHEPQGTKRSQWLVSNCYRHYYPPQKESEALPVERLCYHNYQTQWDDYSKLQWSMGHNP